MKSVSRWVGGGAFAALRIASGGSILTIKKHGLLLAALSRRGGFEGEL
jgi:hypothetical protein